VFVRVGGRRWLAPMRRPCGSDWPPDCQPSCSSSFGVSADKTLGNTLLYCSRCNVGCHLMSALPATDEGGHCTMQHGTTSCRRPLAAEGCTQWNTAHRVKCVVYWAFAN
jgi:hypothetical protein